MQITDKIAVVTGAASGIGLAVARELIQRRAKGVALVDRSEAVNEVANEMRRLRDDVQIQPFVGDVTDAGFRRHVYETVNREIGLVSICVPAAGITRDRLATKIDKESGVASIYPIEDFRLVTEINLIAPVYWALEMVGHLAEARWKAGLKQWKPEEGIQGVVTFIGSVSSLGNKGQISYAAAKAGLEGAAATLMGEAIFHGVRCGTIHPGYTDTPMVRALSPEYIEKNILPLTQLHRLIRPYEIADAVCFMITNSAVSGSLWADAGWHPSV